MQHDNTRNQGKNMQPYNIYVRYLLGMLIFQYAKLELLDNINGL
jgi:hypothetical protein